MKTLYSFLFLFFLSVSLSAQAFELKPVDAQSLKSTMVKSDSLMTGVYAYLIENYKPVSKKTNVLDNEETGEKACQFTLQFEQGITYSIRRCNEEGPLEETVTFPPTTLNSLKKWVEDIYHIENLKGTNVWSDEQTTFRPKGEDAGCYYKIIMSKTNNSVEIWCGC